ncbi:MAG: FKBP-type peptidyl-prolyl cis-trans isomerase [Burkholderiales bacterium]|nr:FKBP-type peptidyl-prolyl cis-trans isomerase [Burkholderiales bacterium]
MLAVTLAFAFGGIACAQALDTDEAKESYSLGASVGNYLSGQIYKQTELGLPVNLDLVIAGVVDALKKEPKLTGEETITFLNSRADKLNALQEAVIEKMVTENKEKSEKYLAENKAKKGVVETESGLQYEVVSEGQGITPHEEDVVTIEYTGRLPDGTYFEGSEAEKKTDKFVVMTVVPGLQEGLGLMKEGAEYKFAIPAKLAYGVHGAGPIPPESVILFDLKLVKVEKPGANKEVNPDGQPKKAWPHG